VLLAAAESPAMTTLMAALSERGIACDLVHTLAQARETFLARGGHAMLVMGPGMTPAASRALVSSLVAVDPDLRVAVFEDHLAHDGTGPGAAHAIPYHPSSRAAVGAILKLLHGI
jgi:hypothetical protein